MAARTITPDRVKAARRAVSMPRDKFARILNITVTELRAWEDGKREPTGAEVAALELIEEHPGLMIGRDAQLANQPRWAIPFTRADLERIADVDKLVDVIMLGRFVNSIRTVISADAGYEHDEHPARWRARWVSLIYAAGVLHEAFRAVEYMARRYKTRTEWQEGLGVVLAETPRWLRTYLKRVRDKGAFHFDDRELVRERIQWLSNQPDDAPFKFDLVNGEGNRSHATYHAFADLLVLTAAMAEVTTVKDWLPEAEKHFQAVRELLPKFASGCDKLASAIIDDLGLAVGPREAYQVGSSAAAV